MNFKRLNRVTYGVTEESLKELNSMGWESWVDEQLEPKDADAEVDSRIKNFKMTIEWEGRNKRVGFERYFETAKNLWQITQTQPIDQFEVHRPAYEAIAYSWIKQMHSKWQLNEIMVEFWHNHFNVSIESDEAISLLFPIYDREVIRKHTFGNFRKFLEATAKSPCMLFYLDNVHSKASPANENYARELMELHTMGEDAYVNHLYQDWEDVPGAKEGKPIGFIDEDIYEIARAFTGWSVGHKMKWTEEAVPATGEFFYNDTVHDHYQKRIFGVDFDSHRAPMQDALDVLDMVASHPATGKFLCKKLCTWLISDNPPQSIIDKAVKVWNDNYEADDQIQKVVKVILMSKEFETGLDSKIKRPNVVMSSFFRTVGVEFMPFADYYWYLQQMGYAQYNWGPPTGQPDNSEYWVNSYMMLKRWNILGGTVYAHDSYDEVHMDLPKSTPIIDDLGETIQYWAKKMHGKPLSEKALAPLKKVMWEDIDYDTTFGKIRKNHPKWYDHKLRALIAMLACSPEFQKR